MRRTIAVAFFFLLLKVIPGQTDTLKTTNYKCRKTVLATTTGIFTAGSLIYLNESWYKQYNSGQFHFFNDNAEWLQMDKAGHVITTYQGAVLMMQAFDWAGYNKKQKLFIGGGFGLVYMSAIECMDGFSTGWGFSWGDELANVLGASAAIAQEAIWNEQRIHLKFSYSNSGLAGYNPALLGTTPLTRVLKDYNGQTYWLSVNPFGFTKKKNKFPAWLNLSFGYGAYGMLNARPDDPALQDNGSEPPKPQRTRNFYLSLDLDLSKIKTKSKVLNSLFSVINILKFPAPAIQLGEKDFKFIPLYY